VVSASSDSEQSQVLSPVRTTAEWLEALSQPATASGSRGPLLDVVTRYPHWPAVKPPWAWTSKQIGGSNQDCVLAAFRSASSRARDESSMSGFNTSSDDGIRAVARLYGMSSIKATQLRERLPPIAPNQIRQYMGAGNPKTSRAFIQAPALDNKAGRFHAYAALGIDSQTHKVIAWDPDADHADLKLVPISLIELTFV
jgi:hypothetical protein